MSLRNRVVMAPMVTMLASDTGAVTQRMLDYYEQRARGGVGLIIVEATYVHHSGRAFPCQLGIDREGTVPGHYDLVEAIHRHGAKAAIQIHHAGANIAPLFIEDTPVAPSPVPPVAYDVVPRELTVAEIEGLADAFARAAERARRVGYDAVELHGAHGFLIHQFLSPVSNKRTDLYGGSFENRLRFPLMVISRVREAVGPRYPLMVRISAEGGYDLEEGVAIARAFQDAGVDCIDVSIGGTAPVSLVPPNTSPMAIPEGYMVPHAAAIKHNVTVPTITVGEIRHPSFAEEVLSEGRADLVALARPFYADPEWPRKAQEGREDEIRNCISCDYCRLSLRRNRPARCFVNPVLGRERDLADPRPVHIPKRVVVVGGGPAGMQAALAAAQRGHRVTLYEREPRLGGRLWPFAAPPSKQKGHWLRQYLETGLAKAGVQVHTSQAFTPDMLDGEDAVIIATGSRASHAVPAGVVLAADLLQGKATPELQGKEAVVLGGDQVACETAEFLTSKGCQVTIVTSLAREELAEDVVASYRSALLGRLEGAGVGFVTRHEVRRAEAGKVVTDGPDGKPRTIEADLVVISEVAGGAQTLADELSGKVKEVYAVGDCVQPGSIPDALYSGLALGIRI